MRYIFIFISLTFFVSILVIAANIIAFVWYFNIKYKNLWLAVLEQGPLKRAFRNFLITRNAWGMFSINSHKRLDTGKLKVMYNTKESAQKAADSMKKKQNKHFSVYKCIFCDGYHLGKNRDNK